MKIAFISSEVYPFAKTGGLADVSYALPKALAKAGHDVCVFMPLYRAVDKVKYGLHLYIDPLNIEFASADHWSALFESSFIPCIGTFFIDNSEYFGRDGLYNDDYRSYKDNAERFAFFSKAVIECLKKISFRPDIIHCNDWHTGLIPVFLKTLYSNDSFYKRTALVMTVHNAGYQGNFSKEFLKLPELNSKIVNIKKLAHSDGISFLKAGILFSDKVTTVSRKYSEEIKTEEFGYDLAGEFRSLDDRLSGIPNAIDHETWDPETDTNLPGNYSAKDLSGKTVCKLELQKRFGLPADAEIPMLGVISRLTFQKGMDILADSLEIILQDEKFQFIIIGSGDVGIIKKYEHIKKMFPENTGLYQGYNEELEHLAEAGLDIFIMPSRYEPCGLNQMYSLKYGTIPVVRATGGLDDAITEWDRETKTGNGFKFNELSQEELYGILRKVIREYRDKGNWVLIQRNAMNYKYTWDKAVKEYEKVYRSALKS